MKPVKCVCGGKARVVCEDSVWYVYCDKPDPTTEWCWCGPLRKTEEEAIQAWNEVMGCFEEVGQLRRVLDGIISVAEVLIKNGDIRGSMSLQGWCAEGKELLKRWRSKP